MLVLLEIDAVLSVNHDHPHTVGPGKVQPKLTGNLFHIVIVDLISEQQVVEIIPCFFIFHSGLHNQTADTLSDIHKRRALPADKK